MKFTSRERRERRKWMRKCRQRIRWETIHFIMEPRSEQSPWYATGFHGGPQPPRIGPFYSCTCGDPEP